MRNQLTLVAILGSITLTPACWSRYPPFYSIDPPGGQRGTIAEVILSGEKLSDFEDLLFLEEGIELAGHEILCDTRVLCRFRIAADAKLGPQPLRLRTRSGISHLVLFSIGNLEEHLESEPNDSLETAQPIRKGITLNGRTGFEDVDYYSFHLKEGERLSVEIEGIRLGSNLWNRRFCVFDPELRLFGPDGALVLHEDDTPPLSQDPAFVYSAVQDGTYTLAVSDSAFAGFGRDPYRLHVGGLFQVFEMRIDFF